MPKFLPLFRSGYNDGLPGNYEDSSPYGEGLRQSSEIRAGLFYFGACQKHQELKNEETVVGEREERIIQFAEASRKLRDEFVSQFSAKIYDGITSLLSSQNSEDYSDLDNQSDDIDAAYFTPIEAKLFLALTMKLMDARLFHDGYISLCNQISFLINRQSINQSCIVFECTCRNLCKRGYYENIVVAIRPQQEIETETKTYRVDLKISIYCDGHDENNFEFCIEFDGHEFHEKTKEQAQYDKQRDREIQRVGYSIIHYTGREAWNDPEKVIDDIFNHLVVLLIERLSSAGLCRREEILTSESKEPVPF